MVQQGTLFGLVMNTLNYRSILYTRSRITITGNQQCAGLKQKLIDKVKDLNIPERPKKPLTPYFRYAMEQKPHILKKFPDLKLVEISKKLAADWALVSDNLKEEYGNTYKMDMDAYKKMFDEYNKKLTPVQKEALESINQERKADKQRRQTRKTNKDEAKPKRPVGPYMLYLLETAKREGLKFNEMLSTMTGKWAMLSDYEKDKYKEIYDEDKKRYEAEMNVWESKMIQEGKHNLVRQSTLSESKPSRLSKPDGSPSSETEPSRQKHAKKIKEIDEPKV